MNQENGTRLECWPKVLPMIHMGVKTYFVDLRLRQFRSVSDPGDYVEFESDDGRRMCEHANIISCPDCKVSIIVPGIWRRECLSCIRCLTDLQ